MSYLREKSGIVITLDDLITYINFERVEGELERKVRWGEVPLPIIKDLFEEIAREFEIPVSMLITPDIQKRPISFLGGKNLNGLYHHFRMQTKENLEEESDTVLGSLKRKLGIENIPRARDEYRKKRIKSVFDSYYPEGEEIELSDIKIGLFLETVADTYKKFFYDIEKDEIINEAWVGLSDILEKEGVKHSDIPVFLHNHLESLITQKTARYYKEKLFDTPLGDGDWTEEDVADKQEAEKDNSSQPEEIVVFRSQREQALQNFNLTDFQREIVRGVFDGREINGLIEDIRNKFGMAIDREHLYEYYDDAIAILLREYEKDQTEELDN